MAIPTPASNLNGLALRLVREGHLPASAAERLQDEANTQKLPLITHLINSKKLNSGIIAKLASEEFGFPLFDVTAIDVDGAPVKLVDVKILRKHKALPIFKRGNKLYVAVADPTNLQGLDEIKFNTGMATEPILVDEAKLALALDKMLDAADTTLSDFAGGEDDLGNLDIGADEDAKNKVPDSETEINDTPIVKFVNKLLLDGINRGASDIHIEPYEKFCRVRYRIDGMLHEVAQPPLSLAGRLAARMKILARLDIAERRVPQDGRIKLRISKTRAIDFRVSTMPTLFGEKVVARILDPSSASLGIEKLGYEPEQQRLFLDAIHRPYGMVLVTGPTGSGKTVSLYTAVNILNTSETNISTAEDPVEINLPGINQVNINDRAGLTFSVALKAFLRQDPDIILVGEIRDLETAEIAIKAAQTGHMVLSTLHTNDAPKTLSRLVNMGVAPFNIASAVLLIVAQRLARRLCPHCKKPVNLPKEALLKAGFKEAELHDLKIFSFNPEGCDNCSNGYKGRVGIYQVMPISEGIGAIIMRGGNALDIEIQAKKDGVADLRESALKKVRNGLTSLEEVERITN
jgi:type IV pilus assembly protein PilB